MVLVVQTMKLRIRKDKDTGPEKEWKGGSRSWLPHNYSVISAPEHVIPGQMDFSQNKAGMGPM